MIETGIVLAAGEGSRLRAVAPLKPLCCVAGRTLLAHAVSGMAQAGLARTVVVVGYEAETMKPMSRPKTGRSQSKPSG